MTDGFVYFLRDADLVKIGYAKNPAKRIKQLATGSPRFLKLIASHPGSRRQEAALQRQFAEYRHRGEWFEWNEKIAAIAMDGLPELQVADVTTRKEPAPALKAAFVKAGGPSALARILKITPQAVDQWDQIPVGHVLKLEKALGLPRHYQRPDFYPPPSAQEAAE